MKGFAVVVLSCLVALSFAQEDAALKCANSCKVTCRTVDLLCRTLPIPDQCQMIKDQCDKGCDTTCACYTECSGNCPIALDSSGNSVTQIVSGLYQTLCNADCAVQCNIQYAVIATTAQLDELTNSLTSGLNLQLPGLPPSAPAK